MKLFITNTSSMVYLNFDNHYIIYNNDVKFFCEYDNNISMSWWGKQTIEL